MIDSRTITLVDGVAYTFPDDHADFDGIGGSYEEFTVNVNSTVDCLVEIDSGLGFTNGDSYTQTDATDTYLYPATTKVRLTVTGAGGTARITFQYPIAGL